MAGHYEVMEIGRGRGSIVEVCRDVGFRNVGSDRNDIMCNEDNVNGGLGTLRVGWRGVQYDKRV